MSNTNGNAKKTEHCSFCGKSEAQVEKLIAGPGDVHICNECVVLCNEIIFDELDNMKYSDGSYRDAYWMMKKLTGTKVRIT